MHGGILVTGWPAILGCDASGVVLECGDGVSKFKRGDYVFGCTRVGQNEYSTFQETFLMDEDIAFKRSSNVTTEQACTIGVALDVNGDRLTRW
jgi:NADPH:quinone reductase-like Zn-dependent oxidoreductase